jgi:hypothetical protein
MLYFCEFLTAMASRIWIPSLYVGGICVKRIYDGICFGGLNVFCPVDQIKLYDYCQLIRIF